MSFLRGKQKGEAKTDVAEATPVLDGDSIDVLRALDALASVLRSWGENALDLESRSAALTRTAFEGWARHVLLGTNPIDDGSGAPPAPHTARDWVALESFVRDTRTSEVGELKQSLGDLREVVWMFIQCFTKAIASDTQADDKSVEQMQRLRDVADQTDLAALRTEALSAVRLVEDTIAIRKDRYQHQVEQLSEQLDQLAGELVRIKEESARDALTGAHNRAALDEHLQAMNQLGVLAATPPMAFMIDIDHFKWVNDTYGHDVGDEILRRVAARLRQEFRRRSDQLSRFGGDEFTLVVQHAGGGEPSAVADRILFAVRECEYEHEGQMVRVSASVGGAVLQPGESTAAWMKRADRALYEAKNAGRDRGVIADADI